LSRPAAVLAGAVAAALAAMAALGASAGTRESAASPRPAEERPEWVNAPDSARRRVNPYAGQPDAVKAGRKLVARHCAECHGPEGRGGRNAPPLDRDTVRGATDGELFWMLTNGHLTAGMPSWSQLPEPRRWQIVAFLKSHDVSHDAGTHR
jgi:mono/diheme cytochrome c family protein